MQSQEWVVPLVSFKAHNCANDTFRMEKIVCMNQYCSMPPRLFKYLQLVHAIWSSPWFSPSTHPLLSLVDTNLGQLLSCSSSLYNRRRGPPKLSRCLYCSWYLLWLCHGYPLLLGNCLTDYHRLEHFWNCCLHLLGSQHLKLGTSVRDLIADMEVAKAGQQECPWLTTLLGQCLTCLLAFKLLWSYKHLVFVQILMNYRKRKNPFFSSCVYK